MKVRDLDISLIPHGADEKRPMLDGDTHILDAIHCVADAPAGMADVALEGKLIGTLTVSALIKALSDFISPAGEYSTIEINCRRRDYLPSAVARAVEDANTAIIGLIVSNADDGELKITIRVDIENPEHVVSSLQRYGYEVVAVYSARTPDYDKLANQFKALQLYLNV